MVTLKAVTYAYDDSGNKMSMKNTVMIMAFLLLCCVGCTTNEIALEPTNTPTSTPIPKNDDLESSPIVLPTPIFISTRIPESAISLRPDERYVSGDPPDNREWHL